MTKRQSNSCMTIRTLETHNITTELQLTHGTSENKQNRYIQSPIRTVASILSSRLHYQQQQKKNIFGELYTISHLSSKHLQSKKKERCTFLKVYGRLDTSTAIFISCVKLPHGNSGDSWLGIFEN